MDAVVTAVQIRGRDLELSAADAALEQASCGKGSVVVVEGRAGIGKSRFLTEVGARGRDRGFAVVRIECNELDRVASVASLVSALGLGQDLVDVRADTALGGDGRLWLLSSVRSELERRALAAPQLVVVDDVQWADPLTLFVLRSLTGDCLSLPVLWLLGYRAPPHVLQVDQIIERLDETARIEHIVCGPLDGGAVSDLASDLVGGEPGPGFCDALAQVRGIPFLAVDLVRALSSEDRLLRDGDIVDLAETGVVPAAFQQRVRVRLAALPPTAQHMLDVASVLGRTFSATDLGQILGRTQASLIPDLQAALQNGVLVEDGDALAFEHDLVREAVSGALPASARLGLHREVAGHFLGSDVPERAADHLLVSARPGDGEAIAGLIASARAVHSVAPSTAADLACRALDLLSPSAPDRPDVNLFACMQLLLAGRLRECVERSEQMRKEAPTADVVARALHVQSSALFYAGDHRSAAAVLQEAHALGIDRPARAALLWDQLAICQAMLGKEADAERSAVQALSYGGTASKRIAPMSMTSRSIAAWSLGNLDSALAHAEQAYELGREGAGSRRGYAFSLRLSRVQHTLDRFDDAEAAIHAGQRDIEASGSAVLAPLASGQLAYCALLEGRLDDARTAADAALSLGEELAAQAFARLAWSVVGRLALLRNQPDPQSAVPARSDIARAGVASEDLLLLWMEALVLDATAEANAAVEVLGPVFDGLPERVVLFSNEPPAAPMLTRIALRAGRSDLAERTADAACRFATTNPSARSVNAAAAHATALITGDAELLSHGIQQIAGVGRPWAHASMTEDLGCFLARDGDTQAGIGELTHAAEGYGEMGAERDVARVRHRLRELGVRTRSWKYEDRPAFGWAALTSAELRVASLVAQGLTNREVADRLFTSPYTVATQLKAVFRKLEITSRVELARIAAQHGH